MDIELHFITPANVKSYDAAGLPISHADAEDACAECMNGLGDSYAVALSGTGYWYLCEDCVSPVVNPSRVDYFGKNF
jgi:hypothetical protein